MDSLIVREAVPGDEPGATEIDRLSVADLRTVYRPTAKAGAARSAITRSLRRVVATLDGRVVGTVQYWIDAGRLSLLALGVHPAHRRRGVATALVRHLERIASRSGCDAVGARTVLETGNAAILERMGFVRESQAPTDLFESVTGSTCSEVVMRKDLGTGAKAPRDPGTSPGRPSAGEQDDSRALSADQIANNPANSSRGLPMAPKATQ